MLEVELHGAAITDIASLYDELNRVFMADEDWQLGPSLDALDDLLYGGYGAAFGSATGHLAGPSTDAGTGTGTVTGRLRVVWRDHARSRDALGVATTASWYQAKLAQPGRFNIEKVARDLAALRASGGPTYFDLVLEVFSSHPNVELVLA